MRYLSIDIESTGLGEHCQIIEFGMIPFDTDTYSVEESLAKDLLIKCPPFEELRPQLDPWVIEHQKDLIIKANKKGKTLKEFKNFFTNYLESDEVRSYFGNEKIVLFGKSMNAIDLPFLNRDLGWDWMREYFGHKTLDLSSFAYALVDLNMLPKGSDSGLNLMRYLGMGEVCHTALEDARNTANMYLKLLKKIRFSS